MTIFTDDIGAFIKEHYIGIGNDTLTNKINNRFKTSFNAKQVSNYKKRNGLDSGLKGTFPKGYNGGSFNSKPLGSTRLDSSGYSLSKVSDKNGTFGYWKYTHILLWESIKGPLSKGKRLMFADGDIKNITIDNLILVDNRELNVMNAQGLRSEEPMLTRTGLNVAKLNIAIKDIER